MPSRTPTDTTTQRPASTPNQAPAPRPYAAPKERISRHPKFPEPTPPSEPVKQSLLSRLWPFKTSTQEPFDYSNRDPARGVEASQRVVKEGVLDPRYKTVARHITVIIAVTPLALYLTWELYQRRFGGREQKPFPAQKAKPAKQDNAEG